MKTHDPTPRALPSWHHLMCGDKERVHEEGPSMRGELVSEEEVEGDE